MVNERQPLSNSEAAVHCLERGGMTEAEVWRRRREDFFKTTGLMSLHNISVNCLSLALLCISHFLKTNPKCLVFELFKPYFCSRMLGVVCVLDRKKYRGPLDMDTN